MKVGKSACSTLIVVLLYMAIGVVAVKPDLLKADTIHIDLNGPVIWAEVEGGDGSTTFGDITYRKINMCAHGVAVFQDKISMTLHPALQNILYSRCLMDSGAVI